jgi:hypothetical protein
MGSPSDFTPVTVPFGGSPVIKGFFLGMCMEQVVDALNEKLLPDVADGKPKLQRPPLFDDYPCSVERLPDTRKDGELKCEREWYVVGSRALVECTCEENAGRSLTIPCFSKKWYVLNRIDAKKTIFPFLNPWSLLSPINVSFGNDNTLVEISIPKTFFKAGDIPTADFARMIMNAYHIPELNLDLDESVETYSYRSQNGWQIKISSFTVRLKRVTAISEVKLD